MPAKYATAAGEPPLHSGERRSLRNYDLRFAILSTTALTFLR